MREVRAETPREADAKDKCKGSFDCGCPSRLGREGQSSLRMTNLKTLLHYGGAGVGGFFFVGVDFAVGFGVEGAVGSVEGLGRHGEGEAVFLVLEAYQWVAT